MCCASAALPPLPNRTSLPPPRIASTISAAARATSSPWPPESSCSWRSTDSRTRRANRSPPLVTGRPPRAKPLVLERELVHPRVHPAERGGDLVLRAIVAVEEHDVRLDPERVHDHPVALELDEVEAAERRRVLVLQASLDAELGPLDPERELRDVVVGQREAPELAQQPDQGDHHRRRRAESGA